MNRGGLIYIFNGTYNGFYFAAYIYSLFILITYLYLLPAYIYCLPPNPGACMNYTSAEIKTAFKNSIPVMTAYLFLGTAFGLTLDQAGFSWIWALFMSFFVYAGSLQYVLVPLMVQGISLPAVALMTVMVNIRHLFYGFSFIEDFNAMGRRKPYAIHTLTDETYSLLTGLDVEEGLDRHNVMFLITLMDQLYWIAGSVAGALIGRLIPWDITGIDFSMTALFTVVFTEQWLKANNHLPAVIGVLSSIFFLIVIGPDSFMLPSLLTTVALLMLARRRGLIDG